MQEAQKNIYHCNYCGQLFESVGHTKAPPICNICGKDPLSTPFSNLAALPQVQSTNNTHGVPGKDEADFFSMKKKKNQKKWATFFVLWFSALIGVSIFAYNYNKSNDQLNNQLGQLTDQDPAISEEHLAKMRKAAKSCLDTFIRFAAAKTSQSKSAYLLNGSNLILEINRHQFEKFTVNDIYRSQYVDFALEEVDGTPQAIARMRYTPIIHNELKIKEVTDLTNITEIEEDADLKEITNSLDNDGTLAEQTASPEEDEKVQKDTQEDDGYQPVKVDNSFEFEVVFWFHDNAWKIDWQHYVRLSTADWNTFCTNKDLNAPGRFKIYARPSITGSTTIDGYTEYKFSESFNSSKTPSLLPKSVYVKKGSSEQTQIVENFDSNFQSPLSSEKPPTILNNFDPPNSIRIDTTLDHVVIDGETIIVLKEIHNFDWLTPPATKN